MQPLIRFSSCVFFQHIAALATTVVFLCFFPTAAYAYTLTCAGGTPTGGDIFIGVADCTMYGADRIFSGLNCQFQNILNEVMKRIYCGMQFHLEPLLRQIILLYILVYAVGFTFGILAMTAKELTIRMIKIAVIWSFAMNASWGVGMAFYFIAGGIETAIGWVLSIYDPNMSALGFFGYLDQTLYNVLSGRLSNDGVKIIGFFIVLAFLALPVFLMFVYFFLKILTALMRALVTYLLGLAAIAFLLAMGPIFVSMAFFKITTVFFESWLRYIISFAMQIILTFAATALWLYFMSVVGNNFFSLLAKLIVPYDMNIHNMLAVNQAKDTWGICTDGFESLNPAICKSGDEPLPPGEAAADEKFMGWITTELLALTTIVYAFDTLLRNIPDVARQLSGPKFAPQLGGGNVQPGGIKLPGFTGMAKAERATYDAAFDGLGKMAGQMRDKLSKLGGNR